MTAEQQPPTAGFTHLDAQGRANMVDVSHKPATLRVAVAEALLRLPSQVRDQLLAGELPKGEALAVARVAGIQAAKDTSRLIPLCHPLALSQVQVRFAAEAHDGVLVQAEVHTVGPTGVEMEAMTAASVAALTLYDMCKARCRDATIERVRLLRKSGGKSGEYVAAAKENL